VASATRRNFRSQGLIVWPIYGGQEQTLWSELLEPALRAALSSNAAPEYVDYCGAASDVVAELDGAQVAPLDANDVDPAR